MLLCLCGFVWNLLFFAAPYTGFCLDVAMFGFVRKESKENAKAMLMIDVCAMFVDKCCLRL